MKKSQLLLCLAATAASISFSQTIVNWEVTDHHRDERNRAYFTQRFTVKGDISRLSKLCFNLVPNSGMKSFNAADTVEEIIPGYYCISSARFSQPADSLVIEILTPGSCPQYSFGAQGIHGVDVGGNPFDVTVTRSPIMSDSLRWTLPGENMMAYGDSIYRENERLAASKPLSPFDMAPKLKRVVEKNGVCTNPSIIAEERVKNENPEYYSLDITPEGVKVKGASREALVMARQTLKRLRDANPQGLPCAVIEDWPDFHYRGMMIDAARNFKPLNDMRKIIDEMAALRMNRLQFHFADDEAWRIEIPELPELTAYGSRRGYTRDEKEFPAQMYFGNGNPDSSENSGYYSRQEFIDFLRYCYEQGICVIPEIETPGHARTAIKAMDARWRQTGDDSYRLHEDNDTSRYYSAQFFTDCVLNPALEGPYRLMDVVSSSIQEMYNEAGVPLVAFHIGGDEVPHGAWSGSPSAQAFMKEHGLHTDKDMHAHWVREMAKMLKGKGMKLAGWQDIVATDDAEYSAEVGGNTEYVNLWVAGKDANGVLPGTKAREAGFPVLICAVPRYYVDFAHSYHPEEHGLNWGGVSDELNTLLGYAEEYAPAAPERAKADIVGVQGQLWSETVNSLPWIERYLFPRIFAIAERGWNADTTYSVKEFNKLIGERELPALAAKGTGFHLRQPGIIVENGMVKMNSPYEGAEIRYTLDGSTPTKDSRLYTGPFQYRNGMDVRARLYYLGGESVTTLSR